MASIIRALADGNRDDVLWDVLHHSSQPSYGYFMEPTPANPAGMTTIGEQWDRGSSKNHMILAQIDEWFHTSLAGIRMADGATAYRQLVFQPKPVGDLRHVEGTYHTPQGPARSSWTRSEHSFDLEVTVPPNTTAEVWLATNGERTVKTSDRATFQRTEGNYAVYTIPPGTFTFTVG